jgi:hypothetical protein
VTRSVVVATEDEDDGWDLPPPPARRRWMRRCRCPLRPTTETTKTRARDDATRREGGGRQQGTSVRRRQPVKARRFGARGMVVERSGEMSWSWESESIICAGASFPVCCKKYWVILRPQTPRSYPYSTSLTIYINRFDHPPARHLRKRVGAYDRAYP